MVTRYGQLLVLGNDLLQKQVPNPDCTTVPPIFATNKCKDLKISINQRMVSRVRKLLCLVSMRMIPEGIFSSMTIVL